LSAGPPNDLLRFAGKPLRKRKLQFEIAFVPLADNWWSQAKKQPAKTAIMVDLGVVELSPSEHPRLMSLPDFVELGQLRLRGLTQNPREAQTRNRIAPVLRENTVVRNEQDTHLSTILFRAYGR
jgi:hypothetical protein